MKGSSTIEKLISSVFSMLILSTLTTWCNNLLKTQNPISFVTWFLVLFPLEIMSQDALTWPINIIKIILSWQKSIMFIKKIVKRLEEYLRKSFSTLNISLYVNRRCKFVHKGMHYSSMLTEVPFELIAPVENFEK